MTDRLSNAVYSLAHTEAGFDILHEPKDDSQCQPEGDPPECHNTAHLWPVARLEEQ